MARHNYYLLTRGWMENKALAGEKFCRRSAWAWLIEHAAYKACRVSVAGIPVDLRRGQLAVSLRYLARVWGWSLNRVARFLGGLQTDTMVNTATDTGITVISICNYDRYQFPVDVSDTASDTEAATAADTRKKEDNKYSVGAPPEVTITKVLFDSAVNYLGQYGRDEKESRALCAKWINSARSWSKRPEIEVIDAIDHAKRAGVGDPVSRIFAYLASGGSNQRRAGGEL